MGKYIDHRNKEFVEHKVQELYNQQEIINNIRRGKLPTVFHLMLLLIPFVAVIVILINLIKGVIQLNQLTISDVLANVVLMAPLVFLLYRGTKTVFYDLRWLKNIKDEQIIANLLNHGIATKGKINIVVENTIHYQYKSHHSDTEWIEKSFCSDSAHRFEVGDEVIVLYDGNDISCLM
ncbi:MAG: hypothetical protein KC708_18550 [Anaerolineae bacterium]|nr:hypothetical protein [Anaerolineae bacterium]